MPQKVVEKLTQIAGLFCGVKEVAKAEWKSRRKTAAAVAMPFMVELPL